FHARALFLGVCVLLVAFALFPFIPRVGARIAPRTVGQTLQRLSGFSDTIVLEETGPIKPSDELAFKAIVLRRGALPAVPLWRGNVLDDYDGSTWRTSPRLAQAVVHQAVAAGERQLDYAFDTSKYFRAKTLPTEVELIVEPSATQTII